MKQKSNGNSSGWYILLSVLILILIILVCVLIFVSLSKKQKTIQKEVVYIERELPTLPSQKRTLVYPDELPRYNHEDYQQIGILTTNETDKEPIVLPLFAKKLRNNRDRWQYYTATDKNNMMRLPIQHQNMDCEDTIGCKEIFDGDTVNVEIYKGRVFTATIYKTQSPQYFADKY